jgi:hypothetical protein
MLFLHNYLALIGGGQPQKMLGAARPIHHKGHVSVTDKKLEEDGPAKAMKQKPTILM